MIKAPAKHLAHGVARSIVANGGAPSSANFVVSPTGDFIVTPSGDFVVTPS